jgi:hypothetical protein
MKMVRSVITALAVIVLSTWGPLIAEIFEVSEGPGAIQDRGCRVLPDAFGCRHRHWIRADQGNFHGTTAQ